MCCISLKDYYFKERNTKYSCNTLKYISITTTLDPLSDLVITISSRLLSYTMATRGYKGSDVVVMDKQEYLRLLSDASVNDTSNFRAVPLERPKSKGRPPRYYHPLLEKEKLIWSTVLRILPSAIADSGPFDLPD